MGLKTENRENVFHLGETKLQSYLARGKRLLKFLVSSKYHLTPSLLALRDKGFPLSKRNKNKRAAWMGTDARGDKPPSSGWHPVPPPECSYLGGGLGGGTLAKCFTSKVPRPFGQCSKILKSLFKEYIFLVIKKYILITLKL